MPKVSRYNHFQPWRDGYYIAYNACSGASAFMTADNYALYNKLTEKITSDPDSPLNQEEQQLLRQLQHGRFVIPDNVDEIQTLKFQHNMSRYERSVLGLVIAPTMACNMACEYCYEENKKGRMSAEVIAALTDFVAKRAPGLTLVDIGWYGGEPLLAMDIIEELTRTMLALADQHNFAYRSSMISNGYLLSKETVDRLVDFKVASVQVTLDGPARLHNKKRPLKNGRDSFDTILGNLVYASTKMGVAIRINVDKSFTAQDVVELLQQLAQANLQKRVAVYFGQLEPATKVCANISEACFGTVDFSKLEVDYHRLLLKHGFRIEKLPSPITTFCMVQNVNAFLIDPEGNLYRCYNNVGDLSRSFGNVRQEIDYQHPNFTSLFMFDPFEDEDCLACDFLPICMGGCPSQRVQQNMSRDDLCNSWKHNLQPMLEIIALSRQQPAASALKEKS